MKEWIREETEIAAPKIQVTTKISKWEKYEYIEINGFKFIRGSSSDKNSQLFEFKKIDNMNVLLELLMLYNSLEVKYSLYESEISKNITQNDISLIIKFCKRNGLPRWGNIDDMPVENYCVNGTGNDLRDSFANIFYDTTPYSTENIMHIPSFIRALHFIKMDFLRIVASHDWDYDINIQHFLNDTDKQFLQKVNRSGQGISLHLFMPHYFPYTTYWNNEKSALILHCENLLHLSTYYLCVLRQQEVFSSGVVVPCRKCGNYFVAHDSRMKFCNNPCTRQSYYANKKRKSALSKGANSQ